MQYLSQQVKSHQHSGEVMLGIVVHFIIVGVLDQALGEYVSTDTVGLQVVLGRSQGGSLVQLLLHVAVLLQPHHVHGVGPDASCRHLGHMTCQTPDTIKQEWINRYPR